MKTYPTEIQNALNSNEFKIFLLVKIGFQGQTIRATSLPYDVVYEDSDYISDAGLIQADNPKQNRIVDNEGYTLTFADNANEFKDLFDLGATGSTVEVKFSVFDSADQPYLDSAATAYIGRIDEVAIHNDMDTKTAQIKCGSPLADLDVTNPRYTTRDGQDQIDDTDTCFDNIYEGGQEITIKWGKA